MSRAVLLGLFLAAAGCQLPDRQPPRPLPEDTPPLPYVDLVTRARLQAAAAVEAFYVDRWAELEDAAVGLEQTARFLPKATDVPTRQKDELANRAEALRKEAVGLRDAARARDVKLTNEVLQRVNLKVRELRPEG